MEGLSSVDRALDVLFHLHVQPQPCGVSEIGRALGLPKSSAHRLLQTLSRRALVERDPRGRYRPGLALLALGLGALDREPIVAASRPVLEVEAQTLGETAFLVSARAGNLTVLDKVEGTGFLRASPQVGTTVPPHATAVGKLYLALAPELLAEGARARFTPRTFTTAAALRQELSETAARGYGVNDEEWIEGLSVVAAPIVAREQLLGAIAIAAPTPRMNGLRIGHVGKRCIKAALQVAANLAGRDG